MRSALYQKIAWKLIDLLCKWCVYDEVAKLKFPSSDIITSLKLSMMKSGATAELTSLEDMDLNAIAKEGSKWLSYVKLMIINLTNYI